MIFFMDLADPPVVWQPAARLNYDTSWNRCVPLPFSKKIKFQAKPNVPEKASLHPSFLRDTGALATKPGVTWFFLSNDLDCGLLRFLSIRPQINIQLRQPAVLK
jgi:hypothetical protein